ncbi:MAG: hypothetical protein HKL90_06510 [Elusimicrobia bacterium]|nr:hypothetical protein [Elusimicrobiota bacterium]
MNANGKAQVQAVAAGLLGFGLVVGVGAYFVVPRGEAPASAVVSGSVFAAPASRVAELPVPAPATFTARAPSGSPAPLLSDEFRPGPEAAPQPQGPAAPTVARAAAPAAVSGAVEAARSEAAVHLIATGPADVSGGAGSSYSVPTAPGAAPSGAAKSALTAKAVRVRSVAAVGAVVHYGSSDRSQLMERAAGPVYNFGALGERGDPIAGALHQVDAVQQQVQAAPGVSAADMAALNQGVSQVHAVAYQAGAAAQATVAAGAAAAPSGSR